MAKDRDFRVLVATDASHQARAAISTALDFPWPAQTRVRGVVARDTREEHKRSILLAALDRGAEMASESGRRALSRRWRDAEVTIVDKTPVDGILAEASGFAADAIVVGWRGHGPIRRFLAGSVSRGVVRNANCAVLVVRRRQRVRTIVVGLDLSQTPQPSLAFMARLTAPSDGRVTLVHALPLIAAPSRRVARAVAAEIHRKNAIRRKTAMRILNRAAARLERRGWKTRTILTSGEPLRDILQVVAREHAQLVVAGASSTSGVRRLLLGSVAEGLLNRCPVPVVIAHENKR